MNALDTLAVHFGTDKGSQAVGRLGPKYYTYAYDQFLQRIRHRRLTLLEIGVYKSASLRVWSAYLTHPGTRVVGVDLDPACQEYASQRIHIETGDQADPVFLQKVAERNGPFDVVIDDGGHQSRQHRASLDALFPQLQPGGLYAIEDLHTMRLAKYGPLPGTPGLVNTLDLILALAGVGLGYPPSPELPAWAREVRAVHVYPYMAILEKTKAP